MSKKQPVVQNAKVITNIPGPQSKQLRAQEDKYLADGLQGFATMSGIVVDKAEGNVVTDVDGNELLDIIGGIGVNGLGHSHPVFVNAMKEQLEQASVGSFTSKARVEFLTKFQEVAPGKLNKVQFYSGGSEAVESAIRLSKDYTGKFEMVSFNGAFHGKTHGTLGLMGSDFKKPYGPFAPGCHQIPFADCYRCPLKMKHPTCSLACVDVAKHQLKNNTSKGVAAIIAEPMQGTAGNIIPPDDFLPAIKNMAEELDALFIADEMICGFGRTGKFWGTSHSGVTPDIMTVGKLFGGGFPVSGLITTEEIAKTKPWGNPSGSSSSYGGNPLASQAANTSLEIIQNENLVENSRIVGKYFLDQLKPFEDKYPFIGLVDGRGLFIRIELVENKATKEPLAKAKCSKLFDTFLQRGLLTMSYAPHFRIQPALILDTGTVDNIVSIMRKVFDNFKH